MSKVIRLPFDLETDEFEEMQWFHKQFMKSHPVLKYFVQKNFGRLFFLCKWRIVTPENNFSQNNKP